MPLCSPKVGTKNSSESRRVSGRRGKVVGEDVKEEKIPVGGIVALNVGAILSRRGTVAVSTFDGIGSKVSRICFVVVLSDNKQK
jgi:hypothetical protein